MFIEESTLYLGTALDNNALYVKRKEFYSYILLYYTIATVDVATLWMQESGMLHFIYYRLRNPSIVLAYHSGT